MLGDDLIYPIQTKLSRAGLHAKSLQDPDSFEGEPYIMVKIGASVFDIHPSGDLIHVYCPYGVVKEFAKDNGDGIVQFLTGDDW